MTAGSVTPIEQVEDQLRAGLVEVTASCRDSLTSVLVSGQAMISGCQTMNGMLLAFLQSRAKGKPRAVAAARRVRRAAERDRAPARLRAGGSAGLRRSV